MEGVPGFILRPLAVSAHFSKGDDGIRHILRPSAVGADHQVIVAAHAPVAVGKEVIIAAALPVRLADQLAGALASTFSTRMMRATRRSSDA